MHVSGSQGQEGFQGWGRSGPALPQPMCILTQICHLWRCGLCRVAMSGSSHGNRVADVPRLGCTPGRGSERAGKVGCAACGPEEGDGLLYANDDPRKDAGSGPSPWGQVVGQDWGWPRKRGEYGHSGDTLVTTLTVTPQWTAVSLGSKRHGRVPSGRSR